MEKSAIDTTDTNKAYWKMKAAENDEEYELTGIPSSLPPLPYTSVVTQSGEIAYDFIPGDK